jgi:phosphatidate cytidylyltransferase
MPATELGKRLVVAAIGIPFALAVVYRGGLVLAVVLAAVAAGAVLELDRLARRRGVDGFGAVSAVAAAALVLTAGLLPVYAAAAPALAAIVLALVLVAATGAIWLRGPDGAPLAAVAVTVFGALYTGGTLAFALFLRHLPVGADQTPWGLPGAAAAWAGTALVFFPLVLTWINDSCAYFAGRRWGRRRLIPSVSPGKTVEGAIAGLIGALLAGLLFGWLLAAFHIPLPLAWAALGGILIGALAQVGDLAESLFKREAGVKDSGALLPGHGGVLDRFDALFFTVPVAYFFLGLVLGRAGGLT